MSTTTAQPNRARSRNFLKRALASIAALILGVSAVALGATSANAAPEDHVKIELYSGGTLVTDGATVHEGQPLTMRIDYTYVPTDSLAGQTVVFDFSGLDLDLDDFDLSGNDAVESVVVSGNTVTVKFVDTWPSGVTTGYVEADFEITGVDGSGEKTLNWDVNGEDGGTIQLIVVEESDETPDLGDAADKEVGTPNTGGATPTDVNLNGFVVMGPDGSGATEFKSLDCDALNGTVVPYTLTLEIADGTTRADYTITDALPAGLDFVPTSLSATRTFWDNNGVNKQTVAYTDGVATPTAAGFTYTIPADSPVEGPAIITVDFDAVFSLSASECTDLENQLRTAYQNLRDGDAGSGNFNVRLRNTATFPTIGDRHGDLYIGGTVPGPGIGTAFGKADDLGDFYVVTDDDGLILQHGSPLVDGPVDVNYTLRANLGGWTGADADHTLQRNVVITDTLPTTANWNTGHTDFITTTGNIALTAVIPCPADISTNTYVGNYCVDGQTFRANIGQSNTTNGTIVLKAQLHHVDAVSGMQQMTGDDGSTVQGGERWRLRNTANFAYRTTGNGYNATSDLFPNVLPDNHEEGINDTAAFLKNSPASVSVGQGESAVIPFTLRVDTAKTGISLADSRIVDEVDHSVFDLGDDLSGVTISGTYAVDGTTVNLGADDFELTLDGEDLVIVLSDEDGLGLDKTDPAGPGGVLTVNLGLRTHPVRSPIARRTPTATTARTSGSTPARRRSLRVR